MPSLLSQKLSRLQSLLKKQTLDCLVIGNIGHQISDDVLYYLTLKKLEYGILLVPRRGKATLFGIPFEVPELAKQYPELNVKPLNKPITELLQKNILNKERIGFRPTALPANAITGLAKVSLVEFEHDHALMGTKFPEEIAAMKKVCRLTDQLFSALVLHWSEFRTESQAANFLAIQMAHHGVEQSFPTIIASGAGAANPHHTTSNKKISRGFCVIDMGIRLNGYCSDMTRTIFVGTPTKQEIELYNTVSMAQEKTTLAVRAGLMTNELDSMCRDMLGKKLSSVFIHRLGHGVGTQVHEWPSVGGDPNTKLEAGMIITIEPGVYVHGNYGIRIEDDVLVKKEGYDILTKSTKKLTTVRAKN